MPAEARPQWVAATATTPAAAALRLPADRATAPTDRLPPSPEAPATTPAATIQSWPAAQQILPAILTPPLATVLETSQRPLSPRTPATGERTNTSCHLATPRT